MSPWCLKLTTIIVGLSLISTRHALRADISSTLYCWYVFSINYESIFNQLGINAARFREKGLVTITKVSHFLRLFCVRGQMRIQPVVLCIFVFFVKLRSLPDDGRFVSCVIHCGNITVSRDISISQSIDFHYNKWHDISDTTKHRTERVKNFHLIMAT